MQWLPDVGTVSVSDVTSNCWGKTQLSDLDQPPLLTSSKWLSNQEQGTVHSLLSRLLGQSQCKADMSPLPLLLFSPSDSATKVRCRG